MTMVLHDIGATRKAYNVFCVPLVLVVGFGFLVLLVPTAIQYSMRTSILPRFFSPSTQVVEIAFSKRYYEGPKARHPRWERVLKPEDIGKIMSAMRTSVAERPNHPRTVWDYDFKVYSDGPLIRGDVFKTESQGVFVTIYYKGVIGGHTILGVYHNDAIEDALVGTGILSPNYSSGQGGKMKPSRDIPCL